MKVAFYGRALFGASSVLLGVASLIGHGSELWQRLRPLGPAFASVIAWGLAIALIIGGAAMLYPRTARFASVVLGIVYGLFTLACIQDITAAPLNFVSYIDFFEQLSIVCGALAVYAATDTSMPASATLGRVARLALGVCVISFAWAQLAYLQYTASLVPTWIPPNQVFWTILTTVAFGLAAIAILINLQARLAIRLMALMLALFGLLVWVPRIATHPEKLSNWTEFSSNYLMTASSWLVSELRAF
jgi:uncharacterized membrane protein YphA (DoxX/SURF4 family)